MEIRVGKGSVTIDDNILYRVGKNFIVLKLTTEAGPCTDAMCQIITTAEAEIKDSIDPDLLTFQLSGGYLAMDPAVYRSIDRGRQSVSIRAGRKSPLTVRNFSFVQ
ncbi:hypothetical protein Thermo_00466 [Thermoplasmatales archaeon]|nr:hypothetical protein Thermo_00466 [Thermoplasmatales archaeon]